MEDNSLLDLRIDPGSGSYLYETSKWAKFLAILGFIITGLVVLVTLVFVVLAFVNFNDESAAYRFGYGIGQLLLVLGLLLIYFFPCLYLYRFASKLQTALKINDQPLLVDSFLNLKRCFKFVGVLTLVMILIYVVAFIFMVTAATMKYGA